nr:MAG TPA: hypothetical protein [Caudoviricetes sp.]
MAAAPKQHRRLTTMSQHQYLTLTLQTFHFNKQAKQTWTTKQ